MNTLQWYNKIARFAEDNPKLGNIQYGQIEIIAEFVAKESAAQQSFAPDGLTPRQKEEVEQMIASAIIKASS